MTKNVLYVHYVEKALGLSVYFANPYASYERGANENLNGPRKRLNWRTPVEVFYEKTGVAIYEGVAINV